ncbi:glycosyl hydrolase family 61-domain-containing protein [Bisporella sp. PMI_857]|nr:glycosyl hydrolase family 61-domain-containing protein [Bisporella sp. PMI_857]
MRFMKLHVAIAAARLVCGHTVFTTLFINETKQGDAACVRMPRSGSRATDPVLDLQGSEMACGFDGTQGVERVCPVKQSSNLSFLFRWWPDGSQPGFIDPSHKGPCAVYMKSVVSAKTDNATGDGWFKIWDETYDEVTKQWCTEKLIETKGLFTINIPSALAGGYYLVRPELLALHEADKDPPEPQFYVGCAQIFLDSLGTAVVKNTVPIPGYINIDEPAVRFDIYEPKWPYPRLGPAAISGESLPEGPPPAQLPVQAEGLLPPNAVVTNGNWWGVDPESYTDEDGCWKASENCYDQLTVCYASAPPTGSSGCDLWERRCEEIEGECTKGNFVGPPNQGVFLNNLSTTTLPPPTSRSQATKLLPPFAGHLQYLLNRFSAPHSHHVFLENTSSEPNLAAASAVMTSYPPYIFPRIPKETITTMVWSTTTVPTPTVSFTTIMVDSLDLSRIKGGALLTDTSAAPVSTSNLITSSGSSFLTASSFSVTTSSASSLQISIFSTSSSDLSSDFPHATSPQPSSILSTSSSRPATQTPSSSTSLGLIFPSQTTASSSTSSSSSVTTALSSLLPSKQSTILTGSAPTSSSSEIWFTDSQFSAHVKALSNSFQTSGIFVTASTTVEALSQGVALATLAISTNQSTLSRNSPQHSSQAGVSTVMNSSSLTGAPLSLSISSSGALISNNTLPTSSTVYNETSTTLTTKVPTAPSSMMTSKTPLPTSASSASPDSNKAPTPSSSTQTFSSSSTKLEAESSFQTESPTSFGTMSFLDSSTSSATQAAVASGSLTFISTTNALSSSVSPSALSIPSQTEIGPEMTAEFKIPLSTSSQTRTVSKFTTTTTSAKPIAIPSMSKSAPISQSASSPLPSNLIYSSISRLIIEGGIFHE